MGTGGKEMFVSYDTGSDVGLLPLKIDFIQTEGNMKISETPLLVPAGGRLIFKCKYPCILEFDNLIIRLDLIWD